MKKLSLYIIFVFCLALLIVGSTFAYFTFLTSANTNTSAYAGNMGIIFTGGNELTGSLDPSNSRDNSVMTTASIRAVNGAVLPKANLYINIEEISSVLASDALVWELEATKNNQSVSISPSSGTFASCMHNGVSGACQNGDKLYIVTDYLLDYVDTEFTVYIWLDNSEITESVVDAVLNASLGADTEEFTGIAKGIPEEYHRVEYIASSGTQYLNTGVFPTNDMDTEIVYMDTSATGSNYVLGSRNGSSTSYPIHYALTGTSNGLKISFAYEGTSYVPSITRVKNKKYFASIEMEHDANLGYRMHAHLNNITDNVSYEGYTAYNINGIASNSTAMYVFGFNSGNVHKGMRLYYLKFWKSGVLVANFVPCYRVDDGNEVIGLYDTVNGTFKTGVGTFTRGNELN